MDSHSVQPNARWCWLKTMATGFLSLQAAISLGGENAGGLFCD